MKVMVRLNPKNLVKIKPGKGGVRCMYLGDHLVTPEYQEIKVPKKGEKRLKMLLESKQFEHYMELEGDVKEEIVVEEEVVEEVEEEDEQEVEG